MSDYVLADDLSGALEAGAAFRARGRHVTLCMDEGAVDSDARETLRLFSSETRNLPGSTAAGFVRPILSSQKNAGARLVFKKIDSTLRGPVGGELIAVMDVLSPPLIVVCPATPAVGRTVQGGVLLVNGVPVAETEFRHDPGSPVTESVVASVLAAQGIDRVTPLLLARLREVEDLAASERTGVLVSDAETDGDLARLVSLVLRAEPNAVFVGAGGLAHAVARNTTADGTPNPAPATCGGRVLIVSGSMKQGSRRQLEKLREDLFVPLLEIRLAGETGPEVLNRLAHLLAEFGSASLTIAAGAHPSDPGEPLNKLAEVVRMLSEVGEAPETLALTGGETARAVCAALGIRKLELLGEVERGVVVTRPALVGRTSPKRIVIKPGGFGSDKVWTDLVRNK